MLKQETTTIEGKTVVVTEFPARHKIRFAVKLAKIVPPIIRNVKGLIETIGKAIGEEDVDVKQLLDSDPLEAVKYLNALDMDSLASVIEGVLGVMDADEVVDFLEAFMEFTYVNSQNAKENFDGVFEDDFILPFKVAFFTFKANGFFKKGLIGEAPTQE